MKSSGEKGDANLLDQQLRQLEQQFLEEGGFTERLYRARIQPRKSRGRTD
ncbi:MAG: four helix bundle suffix domain-containing protein [Candidatus Binatota bacterium]